MFIPIDSTRNMRSKSRFLGDSIYDPKTKYAFGDSWTRLNWRGDTKRLGDSWINRMRAFGDSFHKGEHWIKYYRRLSNASYLYYYLGDSKYNSAYFTTRSSNPVGDSFFWGAKIGDSKVWTRYSGFLDVV
jgi:hypothetical protein